jgi:hypothetical protein
MQLTCSLLLEQLCMTTAATALSKIDQHVPLIEAAAAATAATTAQAPPTTAAPRVVTVVDLASPDPEMGYSFDDEEKLIGSTWIAPSSFDDAMLVDVPLGSPIALPPLAPPVQDVLMSLSLHTAPPPALAGVEGVLISHPMKNSADALLDAAEAMVIDDIATPANVTMQSPSLSMRPRSTSSSADALMVDVEADEKSNAIVAASIDVMVPSAQVIDEQTIAEHSIIPMVLCAAPAVDLLDLDLTMMDVLSETNPSAENLGAIQHSNGAAQKPTAGGNNAIMETAATFKTAVSAPGTLQPVPAPSSRPLISPDADDDTEMSQTALSNEDAAKKAAPRRSTAASAAERTESPLSSDSSSDSSSDESTASTSPTAPADESAPPTAAEEAGIKQTAILATFFEGSCLHQRMIRESTSIDSVLDLCTQINPTYRAKLLAVLIDLIWSMKLDHLHRIAEMVSSLLAQEVSLPSVYRVIQTILSFHRMEPNFDAYRRTMARRLDVGKVVQLLNHPSQAIQRHTLHLCLHISRGRTSLLRPALFSCGFFSLRSLGHFVAEGREDEKEDRRVLSELLEYMDVQYWPMTSASDVPQPLPDAIEVLALIANRSTGFLRIAAVAFVMRCLTQSYVRVDTRVHKVDLLRVLCSMFPHHTAPPVTIATFDAVWAFLMPWVEHATAKKDDALIVQPIVKEIIAEGRLEKLQSQFQQTLSARECALLSRLLTIS